MTKLRELWRKLYTTLYLDTLVARLLILFLLAFAVIQIANSVLLSELRMYHKKLGVQEAAMRMAVYARTLEMLPKAERQNYIDLLTHIYSDGRDATEDLFGLSDEKPDLKEIDSKPAHTYAAALKRNFRQAGMERNFIVQPIGGDQIPHKDYPVPYMVTAIELSDGTWATVAHRRDHGQEAPWIYRRAASMVIVVLALLAMGLVLHSTKPLRRLAAGAEAFGRSPEFSEPLSETGSREIREVSQSFNRMRERICATFEERDRIVAAMAHDLRTPLTRARLCLERMGPEKERESLAMDLSDLELFVTKGLEYARSRSSTEKQVLLDVLAFIESIVDDARDCGEQVCISIDSKVTGPLLVKVRPSCLKRCVNNLMSNALTYATKVEVRVQAQGNTIILEIADNGPGIPEDKLEQVFMPYYRLDVSRNASFGGLGLGLSIARNMAQLDGGTLSLYNSPKGGLVARIELKRQNGNGKKDKNCKSPQSSELQQGKPHES